MSRQKGKNVMKVKKAIKKKTAAPKRKPAKRAIVKRKTVTPRKKTTTAVTNARVRLVPELEDVHAQDAWNKTVYDPIFKTIPLRTKLLYKKLQTARGPLAIIKANAENVWRKCIGEHQGDRSKCMVESKVWTNACNDYAEATLAARAWEKEHMGFE